MTPRAEVVISRAGVVIPRAGVVIPRAAVVIQRWSRNSNSRSHDPRAGVMIQGPES